MKPRKVYKRIAVNGVEYQYALSMPIMKLFLYRDDVRHEISLADFSVESQSWRGKHEDAGFGKREVATIIKQWENKS